MPLVPAKCPECGGNVVVDNEKDAWVCDFCKTPFIVEKAINSFNTINNTTNNVTNNNDIKADVVNVYESKNQDFVIKAGKLVEYNGASMDVVIPEEVAAIEPYVFQNSNIHSITLHNHVSGEMSFSNCINLEKVTLPENMMGKLPEFGGCRSLKAIIVPAGISSIPKGAFWGCSSLEEITIPAGVSSISPSAFRDCISLKQIHLPENLKEIGQYAFTNCKSLEQIKLPDSLTSIPHESLGGLGAFGGCDSLFEGCEALKEMVLPDSIDRIGKRMFYNCKLLESITANGVRAIEEGAFKNCLRLKELPNFPLLKIVGGTQFGGSIPEGAFEGCSALRRVVLKENIEWGDSTFKGCSGLEEVQIEGIKDIMGGFFSGCHNIRNLNVESIRSIAVSAFENSSYIANELVRNNFIPPEPGWGIWKNRKIVEYEASKTAKLASEIFYGRMEKYIHRPLGNRKICPMCNLYTVNFRGRCTNSDCVIRGQNPEEAIKGMAMNIKKGLCPSCGAKLDTLAVSDSTNNLILEPYILTLECHNRGCRLNELHFWQGWKEHHKYEGL